MPVVFRCPACAIALDRITVLRGKAFCCPTCRAELAIQFPLAQSVFWLSVLLSTLLSYGMGFRGWALVLACVVGWLPIGILGRSLLNRVSPPKIVLHAEVAKAARPKRPSVREVIREHGKPTTLNLRDEKHREN